MKPSIAEMEAWLKESMPGNAAWSVSHFANLAYQAGWQAAQAAQPAQPAQPPQNHVWLVSNRVASMHFWSEDKARKTASGTGSLWMDVSRIDLLDVAAQPAQIPAGYVLVPV